MVRNPVSLCLVFLLLLAPVWPAHAQAGSEGFSTFAARVEALRAASVMKTFLGLLFLQLEAEGKVRLDDRITSFRGCRATSSTSTAARWTWSRSATTPWRNGSSFARTFLDQLVFNKDSR